MNIAMALNIFDLVMACEEHVAGNYNIYIYRERERQLLYET
jgi:hypothetical protein